MYLELLPFFHFQAEHFQYQYQVQSEIYPLVFLLLSGR